ncbi:MAG: ubiquinone biosynthesis hydroxylase [Beijerinckiaceae bacterium]
MATQHAKTTRFDTVIAGGGIAGLALALALKRAGGERLRIALHDPAFAKTGGNDTRAYAIAAGARRMLETLGIWQEIKHTAQPLLAMDITDSSLDEPIRPLFLSFEGQVEDADKNGTEPFAHMVESGPLLNALRVAAESAGVVLTAVPVTDFKAEVDFTNITLANGEMLQAQLLVAADGGKSRLREKAGIAFYGWTYDQSAIVGTILHEREHGGRAVEHFLPSGPFALLPLTGNRSSIVWTERTADAQRMIRRDADTLAAMIEKRFGLELGQITLAGPLHALPLSLGLARTFIGDRLALLGDAAHVIHPIAGQGLNLGLKDAAALAEAIVDQLRLGLDPGAPEVLEAYQQARRFDTAQMAVTTDVLNRLFSNDIAPLRMIRDVGLGLVNRLPGLKSGFINRAAGVGAEMPRLMRGEGL